MSFKDYEGLVRDLISELTCDTEISGRSLINSGCQNKIEGASDFPHQIDVSLKTDQRLILFECKYWKRRLDVGPILVMSARLADIRAANPELEVSAGIVSTKSPTSGAKLVANYFNVDLDVVLTLKDYALLIHKRFFLGRNDTISLGLDERVTVVKKDIS